MQVTIAISVKNAQKDISECLESINRQSEKPYETLIVVDNPDDPTIPVAKEFDCRIVLNNGKKVYDARNTALRECNTEVLAFTSSDCILDEDWVHNIKKVLCNHRDVVGGTGPYIPIGEYNFAGWLHHMWYVVEAEKTGYTKGAVGGNSYFTTRVLREVGGWLKIRGGAAEDVYISKQILKAGYRLWFDENVKAYHKYRIGLIDLLRQTVMMGKDIVVMMKRAGLRDSLWWYTVSIPLVAFIFIIFIPIYWPLSLAIFISTFFFFSYKFRSLKKALPRWIARWILIWPYSYGILKGLIS